MTDGPRYEEMSSYRWSCLKIDTMSPRLTIPTISDVNPEDVIELMHRSSAII